GSDLGAPLSACCGGSAETVSAIPASEEQKGRNLRRWRSQYAQRAHTDDWGEPLLCQLGVHKGASPPQEHWAGAKVHPRCPRDTREGSKVNAAPGEQQRPATGGQG
ncbi:hypothetical protein NHX12_025389, partial [Muraenolepis orangiensis]